MNIDEANKIKDKILQIEEYGGIAKHVENIHNHKKFIQQDKESADNVPYLYDILKDIGYLRMRNYGLNQNLMNEIKKLFCLRLPHNENNAPTLFFFEDLFDEIDLYQNLMQNIEPAPNAGEKPEKEEIWESRWRDLKDCGLKLAFSGFDITAVMLGSKLLLTDTRFSEEWKQSWKVFSDNANQYLKKLYKLKGQMPSIAERIHQELVEYNMPDGEFFRFASEIAVIRKSWPKDNYFRYILKPEEVNELYQKAKHIFQEYPPAARIYFFKNALAEETLKHFIQNGCIALLTNDETLQTNSKWSLQGTLDGEPIGEAISRVPMLYAGKKEIYSVHMLGPRVSGWGVRSDRLGPLLFDNEKYKGAFFCSWKEYPTEEILVRFDRFIPKAKFIELVKGAKNFIRLPINAVLKEKDLREEALQQATNAVMGISIENDVLALLINDTYIQTIAQNFFQYLIAAGVVFNAIQRTYKKKSLTVRQGPGASPPETNILHIPLNVSEHQAKKIDLLPSSLRPNQLVIKSINTEQRKIYDSIVDFIDGNSSWHYFAYTLDDKGEILYDSMEKGNIGTNKKIKYSVNKGAQMIFLCIAPEETINKVSQMFEKSPDMASVPDENDNIIWLIYGASKKNSSK